MRTPSSYTTQEVADVAGVHKDTLLRWLRERAVPEPGRDGRGWRVFSEAEAQAIVKYSEERASTPTELGSAARLHELDWAFVNAKTSYLTHGLHPYPAKFIPQIPNALIQELSSVGETVADIFCGSGTTLLEALQLKRHAIGIDANPLAALITEAKTSVMSAREFDVLEEHIRVCSALCKEIRPGEGDLFFAGLPFVSTGWRPAAETSEFWFDRHVVEELAELRSLIDQLPEKAPRRLAKVAFSAIIVAVSKQDSDTRYVRREKDIGPGDTIRKYVLQLQNAVHTVRELSDIVESRFACSVLNRNILDAPETEKFDLVVTSPPYPNAYSYHLYHRTRLLWLGYEPNTFKKVEIGSHRKYSSKGINRATEATFRQEFMRIFEWLRGRLKNDRYACFIIGNSTLEGREIDNAALISKAGQMSGFREVTQIERTILATKKAFNPKIGKIRTEKILVMRKS